MSLWCRVSVIGSDGKADSSWWVTGTGRPDMAVVDRLARLQLAAGRHGRRVVVSELDPDLGDLLGLSGLIAHLGGPAGPGRHRGGEPGS